MGVLNITNQAIMGTGQLYNVLAHRVPVWARRAAVGVLLVGACVVCVYRIGARSMWLDELHHRDIGRGGVRYVMNCPILSVQPAHGYYILNLLGEYITRDMDVGNRLPQAVCAVIVVLLTYLIGKHLFSTGAGFAAAVAVVSNDMFVRYAQENRFYQMGSVGFLAVFYTLVRFLECDNWRRGLCFVLAASFALRTHSYGMLVVAAAAATSLVLVPVSYLCKQYSPYDVRWPTVKSLVIAGLCIVLLWLPYPFRIFEYLTTSKGGQAFDGFFEAPFPLSPASIFRYMFEKFYRVPASLHVWFKWLLLGAVFGSLAFRKGRYLVFLLFFLLATVPALHALNNARAAVMPKRFLYFLPVLAIWVSGGWSMIVVALRALLAQITRLLPDKVGWAGAAAGKVVVTIVLWTIFFSRLLWPVVQPSLYTISQWYYTAHRAVYREIARIITVHARAGDVLWWYPPRNDAWLCERYLPASFILRPEAREADLIQYSLMEPYLREGGAVWWVGVTPEQACVARARCIEIPVGKGALYVTRSAYTNQVIREHDAAMYWRTVLAVSEYPELEAVARLINVYTNSTNHRIADDLIGMLQASYARSFDVSTYVAAYWRSKMNFSREVETLRMFSRRYWWEPRFHAQLCVRERELGRLAGSTDIWSRLLFYVVRDKGEHAERIAAAYQRQGDLKNALMWYERALRVYISEGRHDRMFVRELAHHKYACARAAGDPPQELYSWLQAFWINMDYQRIYEFTNIADKAILTHHTFSKEAQPLNLPCAYALVPTFLEWYAATNRQEQFIRLARRIERQVTAETFPLVAFMFETVRPTGSYVNMVSPERLERIGFDLAHTWDGALGWLNRFYRSHATLEVCVQFWDVVAKRRENFAAAAAINQAMLEFEAGAFTQSLTRIEQFKEEFRATPWMRDRAVTILRGCPGPNAEALLHYLQKP